RSKPGGSDRPTPYSIVSSATRLWFCTRAGRVSGPSAFSPWLPARARRTPGGVRGRGDVASFGAPSRRMARRRRLFYAQRVPHHGAAPRGACPRGHGELAPFLSAAGSTAATRSSHRDRDLGNGRSRLVSPGAIPTPAAVHLPRLVLRRQSGDHRRPWTP